EGVVEVVRMLGDDAPEAFQHFANRLVELGLAGVAPQDLGQNGLELFVNLTHELAPVRKRPNARPSGASLTFEAPGAKKKRSLCRHIGLRSAGGRLSEAPPATPLLVRPGAPRGPVRGSGRGGRRRSPTGPRSRGRRRDPTSPRPNG